MALTERDLQRIKNNITLRSAFYSHLLNSMDLIPDPTVKTACVNGEWVKFNPDYVESLPFEERLGLFAHEADHPSRNHHTRQGNREFELWNEACDLSSNPFLIEDGFKLPKGFLYQARFHGLSAEKIYNILDRERQQKPQAEKGEGKPQDLDVGGCGSVVAPTAPDGKPLSQQELGKERNKWNSAVRLADSAAKRIGNAPGTSKSIIDEQEFGRTDWATEMREFLHSCVSSRYSWLIADPRYDDYMPSRQAKRLGRIKVGIDTSSSVSVRQLEIVKAEFNQMILEVDPEGVDVVFWDSKVQRAVSYEDYEYPVSFDFPGRGGTTVQSFFHWVNQADETPICALIFSDLEINDWGEEPEYPVLWGDLHGLYKAPYGTQIDLSGV